MTAIVDTDLIPNINGERTVKIQNAASFLWAYAPPSALHDEETPIIVEPDSLQYRPNELWKLRRVDTLSVQHYTIQNCATGKYAWDPEPPKVSDPVYLKSTPRVWKIVHAGDGHYLITPVGVTEDELYWTEVNPRPSTPITLQRRSAGEESHWRFYGAGATGAGEDEKIVKIQNAASKLWAWAPEIVTREGVQYPDLLVESENLQHETNEEWRLKRVGDPTKQCWTIQNVATEKYAWDPEPPAEHEPVHQNSEARVWKFSDIGHGYVTITPVGAKEDILFWTELQKTSNTPITLEKMTGGEESFWKISEINKS